jgi:hypothetical protein
MSWIKWAVGAALGVSAWFLLSVPVLSEDGSPRPGKKPPRERPAASEWSEPDGPPGPGPREKPAAGMAEKPEPRGPGGFGPPGSSPRFQPGQPPEGRPRGDLRRPGPPEGPEMPGPGGPPGFQHPPGAPRWPHEDWEKMKTNDPEMFKLLQADFDLDNRARELAMQYRQAPKEKQDTIKLQVEKLVTEHFEVRQQRRALELKRLEEELKRMRDSMDKRKEARERIVKNRVQELLGLDDDTRF